MFRPCIDLHEGKVKQIVGGTLGAGAGGLRTNFVSEHSEAWYAELYKRDDLRGGHVVMLGPGNEGEARAALRHGELAAAADLTGEAHAAGAVDAAVLVDDDLGAEILVAIAALHLAHAGVAAAVAVRVVLKLALAGLVADGAVERVVDE